MKTFFGLGKPGLRYATLPPRLAGPEVVPAGTSVTLLHPGPAGRRTPAALKIGETVKTGQRLSLYGGADYVIAPVTGTVAAVAPFAGDFGRDATAITITAASLEAHRRSVRGRPPGAVPGNTAHLPRGRTRPAGAGTPG